MKTIDEIYEELSESFRDTTDISIRKNSAPAARLYAMAAQIYALYHQLEWTKAQCFPQTATGVHLDYFAQMRALERKGAKEAHGTVRFYKNEDSDRTVVIPAGTVCMTAGYIRFTVDESVIIAGDALYGDASVTAVQAGAFGNVAAGEICAMSIIPVGIEYCENVSATYGGEDEEDDETLRERILASFSRLPNGANTQFYESAALSFSDVEGVYVEPRARGIGTVDVVIASHTGIPDQSLLEDVNDYLQEIREIAVDVDVKAPETESVTVQVQVQVSANRAAQEVIEAVEDALENHFTGKILSCGVSRARLGAIIFGVDGVENYNIVSPAADVVPEGGVLPVAASVTVTEMGE